MRHLTERDRLAPFMRALGAAAQEEVRVYFTGGATAVLLGWRPSTVDVHLVFEPERDEVFRAIADLKDTLQINVELASPAHFLPAQRLNPSRPVDGGIADSRPPARSPRRKVPPGKKYLPDNEQALGQHHLLMIFAIRQT